MKRLATLLCVIPLMLAAGCVSRQAEADIIASAATIDRAAKSLPDSLQVQAIRANAQAIAHALGQDLQP